MDIKISKELRKEALEHLDKIKDKATFVKINNILDPLRLSFERKDFIVTNLIERHMRKRYANNYKKLCEINIKDILDINPQKYDVEDTNRIIKAIEEIREITDRTFWEKLLSVFKGS